MSYLNRWSAPEIDGEDWEPFMLGYVKKQARWVRRLEFSYSV